MDLFLSFLAILAEGPPLRVKTLAANPLDSPRGKKGAAKFNKMIFDGGEG
jgi:hypothetical protein